MHTAERVAALEAAVFAIAAAEFGDLLGHDFHGNQWTARGVKDLNRKKVPKEEMTKARTESAKYRLHASVGRWQGGSSALVDGSGDMQKEAETLLSGKPIKGDRSSYTPGTTRALLDEIDHAAANSPMLYRGMVIPQAALEELKNTKTFDVGLASFSSSQAVAQHFSSEARNYDRSNGAQVLMSVDNVQAFPIEKFGLHNAKEKEWVTSGRFEVVSTSEGVQEGRPVTKMVLHQVGTFQV